MGAELSAMQQSISSTSITKPPGPVAGRRNLVYPEDCTRKVVALPAPAGQVLTFHSQAKWKAYFEASKSHHKLMVINFTASWCLPCHNMKPIISEFATTYAANVEFVQIDVDELMDVAMEFKVQIMPTFVLMKKGKIIDRVTGAKKDELQTKIDKNRRFTHY